MPRRETIKRRDLLQSGLTAFGVGLAGCLGSADSPATPTPTQSSVFRDLTIDGKFLVVTLAEDHDVSQLNLIAPDGTAYREVEVPVGTTKAEVEILDLDPLSARYEHYAPGVHELVAIIGEKTESVTIELRPDLHIVDISQYNGTEDSDSSNILVEIENRGTAPTWIYDITYEGAPNFAANQELIQEPGIPYVKVTSGNEDFLVQPVQVKGYVGLGNPFLLRNQDTQNCQGKFQMEIYVGTPVNGVLTSRILVELDGSPLSIGLQGEFTCDDIQIGLQESNSETESGNNLDGE